MPFQVLSGLYPIAQVREPYTAVGYLAQRVPIIQLLRLTHPNSDTQRKKTKLVDGGEGSRGASEVDTYTSASVGEREEVWTAWDICDGR